MMVTLMVIDRRNILVVESESGQHSNQPKSERLRISDANNLTVIRVTVAGTTQFPA